MTQAAAVQSLRTRLGTIVAFALSMLWAGANPQQSEDEPHRDESVERTRASDASSSAHCTYTAVASLLQRPAA